MIFDWMFRYDWFLTSISLWKQLRQWLMQRPQIYVNGSRRFKIVLSGIYCWSEESVTGQTPAECSLYAKQETLKKTQRRWNIDKTMSTEMKVLRANSNNDVVYCATSGYTHDFGTRQGVEVSLVYLVAAARQYPLPGLVLSNRERQINGESAIAGGGH